MAAKILIIDDEKDMRTYLGTLFKKEGFEIESLPEAVELVGPDLTYRARWVTDREGGRLRWEAMLNYRRDRIVEHWYARVTPVENPEVLLGEDDGFGFRVAFDGRALQTALAERNLRIWGGERPTILLVLAVDEGAGTVTLTVRSSAMSAELRTRLFRRAPT